MFRNGFLGEIFFKLFVSCGKMKFIFLFGNNFIGLVFNFVNNCLNFIGFDVFYNMFSGNILFWICELFNLVFLFLRRNMLVGSVEGKLLGCNSLEFLDVSSNMFSG